MSRAFGHLVNDWYMARSSRLFEDDFGPINGTCDTFLEIVTEHIDGIRQLPRSEPSQSSDLTEIGDSRAWGDYGCRIGLGSVDDVAGRPGVHAFLSYVREDAPAVDQLQAALEAAGVRVWRDSADLWPGQDWRDQIRQAITGRALAFIACFSRNGLTRARSYQSEELILAVDEFRQRPGDPWLIPVRLDDCKIPDLRIGGGRTLAQLRSADLFGEQRERETSRLVAAVTRMHQPPSAPVQAGTSHSPDVLEMVIAPAGDRGISEVNVVRSPSGEASATVRIDAAALHARRAELQHAVLTSASSASGSRDDLGQPLREIGQLLFTALLGSGDVAGVYRASTSMAAARGQDLRVLLRIEDPALNDLPWEAMFDAATGTYLVRREQLIRHVPAALPVAPLVVEPPLRVLGVISSPRGLPALDASKEMELIARAVNELCQRNLVQLYWAPKATWADLHALLLGDQWHVLHFIGHGSYDAEHDETYLALTRGDGQPHLVQADRLVGLLRTTRPMPRLVVLNSCAGPAADVLTGVAHGLVRGGVSAVAAMQYAISDHAAMTFAREFYGVIARGRGVDDAVSSGRKAIAHASNETMEWITPVLYLRGEDSHLFTLPESVLPTSAATGFGSGQETEQAQVAIPARAQGIAVVMCALNAEYAAMRAFLTNLRQLAHPAGTIFEVGDLAGSSWQIALARTSLGNYSAGIVADRAISVFGPDVLLSVGTAAALKSHIALGDVAVAIRVDAYQSGLAGDLRLRPLSWDAPHWLEQTARRLARTGDWQRWLPSDIAASPPAVHFVTIVADEAVMQGNSGFAPESRYADAAVIEMEGAGIAHAARVNAMPALVIRGISEHADNRKTDESEPRACAVAAAFAAALLNGTEIRPRPASTVPSAWRHEQPPDRDLSDAADAQRTESIAEIDSETMADLLDVLNETKHWVIALSRWQHIGRILDVLEAALRSGNDEVVRSSIMDLELLGPVRLRIDDGSDLPAPDGMRIKLAEMIRSVRAQMPRTGDGAR